MPLLRCRSAGRTRRRIALRRAKKRRQAASTLDSWRSLRARATRKLDEMTAARIARGEREREPRFRRFTRGAVLQSSIACDDTGDNSAHRSAAFFSSDLADLIFGAANALRAILDEKRPGVRLLRASLAQIARFPRNKMRVSLSSSKTSTSNSASHAANWHSQLLNGWKGVCCIRMRLRCALRCSTKESNNCKVVVLIRSDLCAIDKMKRGEKRG